MNPPSPDQVRLRITQLEHLDPIQPGQLVLDITETQEAIAQRATAWATVRGYHRLTPVLTDIFTREPPASGYIILINKPHKLVIYAAWPWAPSTEGERPL